MVNLQLKEKIQGEQMQTQIFCEVIRLLPWKDKI